jgi:hypothetical protein
MMGEEAIEAATADGTEGAHSITPYEAPEILIDKESRQEKEHATQNENYDNAASDAHRRAGIDGHFDINLALLKRVKKFSINLPSIREDGRRLQKIILPAKDYKHIYDEFRGGYGAPSRPDLELQVVNFGKGSDGKDILIEVLFCSGRCGYVLSERIEDQLITTLYSINPAVGVIKAAYLCLGDKKFSCLDKLRQRFWRKFVAIYIQTLFNLPNRVAEAQERVLTFSKMTEEDIEREYAAAQFSAAEVAYEDTDSESDTPRKKSKKRSTKGKRRGKAEKKESVHIESNNAAIQDIEGVAEQPPLVETEHQDEVESVGSEEAADEI